jgi:hypothetical protein
VRSGLLLKNLKSTGFLFASDADGEAAGLAESAGLAASEDGAELALEPALLFDLPHAETIRVHTNTTANKL